MEHDFWQRKWTENEIAFHEGKPNELLVRHFERLGLSENARVFLPLCGKTRDIHWLLSRNLRVVGAELSKIAVEQLFAELGVTPALSPVGALTRYDAHNITIFQGDIFEVTSDRLGTVDAVYDRAALVALPKPVRARYAAHLIQATKAAPQLLITYDYDQSVMDGPPFSVTNDEVNDLYSGSYNMSLLQSADVAGGLKGKCPATEHVWLLRHRDTQS